MSTLKKLAEKLGISLEELNKRIKKNKEAEEDKIKSNSKKKNN